MEQELGNTIDLLLAMANVYPGDTDGSLMKLVAELLDEPYIVPEVKVEYNFV